MRRATEIGRLLALMVVFAASHAFAQGAAVQQLLKDADTAYERGEFKKAAAHYDRAIAQEPKGVPDGAYAKRASIFFILGAYEQGEYQKGLQWIQTVAEKQYPDSLLIKEQKALLLSKLKGRLVDAVRLAEEVTEKRPEAFALQLLIGDFYYRAGAGNADKAADAYEAFLEHRSDELSGNDKLIRTKVGFSYLRLATSAQDPQSEMRYTQKAEDHFEKALRARGGSILDANSKKGLCATYAKLGLLGQDKQWTKAVTVCEQVIRDKAALKGDASPFYNVGLAYLFMSRFNDALQAANTYIGLRPQSATGYLLRGLVYERQQQWNQAEGQLLRAKEISANADVLLALGRVYAAQKRYDKAVSELEVAREKNPGNVEITVELAYAYLLSGSSKRAVATAEKALAVEGQETNVRLRLVYADALYESGELDKAKAEYVKVLELNNRSAEARTGLTKTLNRQAAARFKDKDLDGAEKLLAEALTYDKDDQRTNFNLGVISLERGKYREAARYLSVRLKRVPNDLVSNRLMAKAYMNGRQTRRAHQYYKKAEDEALRLRNNPIMAEIYTEWGPLLLQQGKLDEAVDKLERAVRYSRNQPFDKAAKRNFQVASFHRGVALLKAGKEQAALQDLENAYREPALLEKDEEEVFEFALAVAQVSAGQTQSAIGVLEKYSKKGRLGFLKAPYDRIGAELYLAYAEYRQGDVGSLNKARSTLAKIKASGKLQQKIDDLQRSALEFIAYDHAQKGQDRPAQQALAQASRVAQGAERRNIDHNEAVLEMDRKRDDARKVFERLGDRPVEALVNLGILYDAAGNSRKAYELWVEARSKGYRNPKLDEWIEAKKRIFGY